MRILRYFAAIFVDAFGITHPSAEQRDRSALYIASLILLVIVTLCSFVFLVAHILRK